MIRLSIDVVARINLLLSVRYLVNSEPIKKVSTEHFFFLLCSVARLKRNRGGCRNRNAHSYGIGLRVCVTHESMTVYL